MKYLSFRERDPVAIGSSGGLSEAEAESILMSAERFPSDVLTWGKNNLKFGPFCGVLRTPQLMIEILPKIDFGIQSDEAMRGLLVAMLARAGELGLKHAGTADLGDQRNHLLDVFIEDFCDQVKTALRGGAIIQYKEKTENLGTIRGRLELTAHLRTNAFDHSHLLCRFDERSIDNLHNRALKNVFRTLLKWALSLRTRSLVATFLHRFDEVGDEVVTVHDMGKLRFDRTNRHWEHVFQRACRLLAGSFPDVRIGDTTGSALLFNMERLFERVLGQRIRHACQVHNKGQFSVGLQEPVENLADTGFQLKPDIAIQRGDKILAILDAKWKHLNSEASNSGVSSADAYQMNAYADRYRCKRLALVYPASSDCSSGCIAKFTLQTEEEPVLVAIAVDIRKLAFEDGIPDALEQIITAGS